MFGGEISMTVPTLNSSQEFEYMKLDISAMDSNSKGYKQALKLWAQL